MMLRLKIAPPKIDENGRPEAFRRLNKLARIAVPVMLSAAVTVQLLGWLQDPPPPLNDPATRNIVTLLCLLAAGLASWIWFCFGPWRMDNDVATR